MKNKSILNIKSKYQRLDEKNKKLIKAITITIIIATLYLCIVLAILGATGQIKDIPWFLYGDLRYVGYTMGAFIISYLLLLVIQTFTNRKKSIKSKPPNFFYFLFFGMIVYLLLLFILPFGSIY